jgi:hypothetical protein
MAAVRAVTVPNPIVVLIRDRNDDFMMLLLLLVALRRADERF